MKQLLFLLLCVFLLSNACEKDDKKSLKEK